MASSSSEKGPVRTGQYRQYRRDSTTPIPRSTLWRHRKHANAVVDIESVLTPTGSSTSDFQVTCKDLTRHMQGSYKTHARVVQVTCKSLSVWTCKSLSSHMQGSYKTHARVVQVTCKGLSRHARAFQVTCKGLTRHMQGSYKSHARVFQDMQEPFKSHTRVLQKTHASVLQVACKGIFKTCKSLSSHMKGSYKSHERVFQNTCKNLHVRDMLNHASSCQSKLLGN